MYWDPQPRFRESGIQPCPSVVLPLVQELHVEIFLAVHLEIVDLIPACVCFDSKSLFSVYMTNCCSMSYKQNKNCQF